MPVNAIAVTAIVLCQVIGARAGIAGFHKWFSSAFPTAVKRTHRRQQDLFDHVCIDMNQILHVALRKATDEEHAVRRLYKDIDRALKQCAPRQSVVFAFDGSAPVAKLLVQRSRRESVKRNAQYRMSALHLTPGTEFMEKMASAMEHYAFLQCQKSSFRGVRFYISGAGVPGEGELKCVDWIKHICKAGTEESVIIVGGDADLILQGLALTQVKNLFVLSPGEHDAARCTSIWEVVRALEDVFPGQSDFVRLDMMVLMILNGNDYLPKTRGVAFRSCFRSYVKLKAGEKHRNNFLVDGEARTFSREFMGDLLVDMARHHVVQEPGEIDKSNRYPPAAAMFKQAVSRGKLGEAVELEIYPCSESIDDVGGKVAKWRSTATVAGREYSWLHTVGQKKAAMHQAAEMLMKEVMPEVHKIFLEQEVARLAEEGKIKDKDEGEVDDDDYDSKEENEEGAGDNNGIDIGNDNGNDNDNGSGNRRDGREMRRRLVDVETYLSGILWNVQMYVEGYSPNFYWRYKMSYGPSCLEIASWIKENPKAMDRLRPPVSSAPPLPALVSGLCMMPTTDAGRALFPERIQPLLAPGSPLRKALQWRGSYHAGLDIRRVLTALQEQAPRELIGFTREGSHESHRWIVVSLDESGSRPAPQMDVGASLRSSPPKHNSVIYDTLTHPLSRIHHLRRFPAASKRVRVETVAATSFPRCVPWSVSCRSSSSPGRSPTQEGVRDQPYKKAFVSRDADSDFDGAFGKKGDKRQRLGRRRIGTGGGEGRKRGRGVTSVTSWNSYSNSNGKRKTVGPRRGGFGIRVDRGTEGVFSGSAKPKMASGGGGGRLKGEEAEEYCRCPPVFPSRSRRRRGVGRIWMSQTSARPYCRIRL